MKKILAGTFLFLSLTPCLAQEHLIFGQALERYTYQPVPGGVSLTFEDSLSSSEMVPKKTNPHNGYFELLVEDHFNLLTLEKPGYQKKTLSISGKEGLLPQDELLMTRIIRLNLELVDGEKTFRTELTIKRVMDDSVSILLHPNESLGEIELIQTASQHDSLSIYHPGYKPLSIEIGQLFNTQDAIKRNHYTINQLTLDPIEKSFFERGISTAGKRNQSIGDIPASVVLITREEITAQGYQSLADVLENVTGLYLFKDYNWAGGDPITGVRGFFSQGFNNDIIFLVNGINQYQDYWGFYPFASFPIPLESIDRIEIVRGPMSVLYGSGAFFGAINIITNAQPDKEADTKYLTVSAGSLNTQRMDAGLKYKNDRISLSAAGLISSSDGLNEPFSRFLNDSVKTHATTAKMLPLEEKYANLSLGLINKSGELQTTIDLVTSAVNKGVFESTVSSSNDSCNCPIPQANPDAEGSLNRTVSTYGGIQMNYNPKDTEINYNLAISFHNYRTDIDYASGGNRYGESSFLSNALELEMSTSNDWGRLSGIAGTNIRIANDLFTSFDIPGASFTDGNNYIKLSNDHNFRLQSLFGELHYELIPKMLAFTGGGRIEDLSRFSYLKNHTLDTLNNLAIPPDTAKNINPKAVIVPRAAFVYNPTKLSHIKLLYGHANKRPSFGNYTDTRNLHFAVIHTLELNFIQEFRSSVRPSFNTRINISLYHNTIKGLISRVSTVQNNESVFHSKNARDVKTSGIEMSLFLQHASHWIVEVSGSLNQSKEQQTLDSTLEISGKHASYSPFFLGYLKTSYNIQTKPFQFTTAMNMRYITRVFTEYGLSDSNTAQRIGDTVHGYWVSNLNLRMHHFHFQENGSKSKLSKTLTNTFIALNISNLTNSRIQYPATGNNSSWAQKGSAGFGRRIQFTLGINL